MDIQGMQNARLGTIYLWQGTFVKLPLASCISDVLGGVSGGLDLGEVKWFGAPPGSVDMATFALTSRPTTDNGLWEAIKEWAHNFVLKVWGKVKEVFGNIEELSGYLAKIALFVTKKVFAKAAPIIGSAVGLVRGLWISVVAFCEKLSNWIKGKGVRLVQGHPETLVKGIESGLTRSLLEGLYETAKSSLLLGLNIAGSGAASIIDAVAGIIESATKLIWRIAEYLILKKFSREAKTYWTAKSESNSIHLDSMKFNKWLKGYTNKVPLIAAVTLGSGLAGDKMRFLQMYTGEGMVISQNQFDAGVSYLDQMKRTGSRLMERGGLEFDSDDRVIAGCLKLAKQHDIVHTKSKGKRGFFKRLFRIADKVIR